MTTNKKVLAIVFLMLTVLSLATIVNVWINFVDFGKKTFIDKAGSIAESVRDGLTAHMVLNAMDNRDSFLENMKKHQDVKSLRVIRSQKVIEQYGKGNFEEYSYDDIEKEVLSNNKEIFKIQNKDDIEILRVTIPYVASKYSNPNCLSCHTNVNEGDVIGAITLELDIKEVNDITIDTITKIVLISLVFLVLAIIIALYFIKPYIKLFDDLEEGISKAYRGDFSYHVTTKLTNDAGKVAKRLNDLSEIFRFKKTIEEDNEKEKIYERMAYILESNFSVNEYIIFEHDKFTKTRKIALKSKQLVDFNEEKVLLTSISCRANRTNFQVCSSDFHKICDLCYLKGKESICLPFNISEEISITLLMYFPNSNELKRVRDLIPIITNYFELATPVLQTKILMEKLHEKSLKDPMTGLYNRRFLDNYLESEIRNSEKFSVMMVDVDFFKQVNDTYGHDVGDDVIKGLAVVLQNNTKGSDIAVRYGGEEFLIITFNTSKEIASKIANDIRVEFSKKVFKSNLGTFSKTLSIGISNYPEDAISPWHAVKFADVALYNAKESGRNKTVHFEKEMYEEEEI